MCFPYIIYVCSFVHTDDQPAESHIHISLRDGKVFLIGGASPSDMEGLVHRRWVLINSPLPSEMRGSSLEMLGPTQSLGVLLIDGAWPFRDGGYSS